MKKILTVNSHTGWHYLLSKTGKKIDVVNGWNFKNRKLPDNFVLKDEKDIKISDYDILILHRMFHDAKYILLNLFYRKRIILVFHGRKSRQTKNVVRKFIKYSYFKLINLFKDLLKLEYVFITPCVKESWSVTGEVIMPGIPLEDFIPYHKKRFASKLDLHSVAIVGNYLNRSHFSLENLEILTNAGFKITLIGRGNSKLKRKGIEVLEPQSYEEYLNELSKYSFYFSVLNEPEEGFNLSLLEAMAMGLVVITHNHPTSPIRHKFNGIIYYSKNDLIKKMEFLKNITVEEYNRMSINAHNTIKIWFPIEAFTENWIRILDEK